MAEAVVVIDLYSPQRHLWCWMQWQIERELADLMAGVRIRCDWEGFALLHRHTWRIVEPFERALDAIYAH